MTRSLVVSTTVVTEKDEDAVRAVEAFARAAAGLALDGLNVTVSVFGDVEEVDEA